MIEALGVPACIFRLPAEIGGLLKHALGALPKRRQFLKRRAAGASENGSRGGLPAFFGRLCFRQQVASATANTDRGQIGDGNLEFLIRFQLDRLARYQAQRLCLAVDLGGRVRGRRQGELGDEADRPFGLGQAPVRLGCPQPLVFHVVWRIQRLDLVTKGRHLAFEFVGPCRHPTGRIALGLDGFDSYLGGQVACYGAFELKLFKLVLVLLSGFPSLLEKLLFLGERRFQGLDLFAGGLDLRRECG